MTTGRTGAAGTSGMLALIRLEARRVVRNRRTWIFSAVLPGVFFLSFSSGQHTDTLQGINVVPYIMVSMATYGAMNALFTGGGIIAAERSVGWNRQLRIAGLTGRQYVVTKALMAYATALPGLVVVFVIGAVMKKIDLGLGTWAGIALALLAGLLPVAALGVAIGYAARPQTLQAIFGIGSAMLALLGGLWVPAQTFPTAMQDVMKALPTYWSADAGRAVLARQWIGWGGIVVLAVWTVALGALAAWLYRRDSLRPAAAGTT